MPRSVMCVVLSRSLRMADMRPRDMHPRNRPDCGTVAAPSLTAGSCRLCLGPRACDASNSWLAVSPPRMAERCSCGRAWHDGVAGKSMWSPSRSMRTLPFAAVTLAVCRQGVVLRHGAAHGLLSQICSASPNPARPPCDGATLSGAGHSCGGANERSIVRRTTTAAPQQTVAALRLSKR